MAIHSGFQIRDVPILQSRMPAIFFGNRIKLAYIQSGKSGCTLAKQILFHLHHGYFYPDGTKIHYSKYALWSIWEETRAGDTSIEAYNDLNPSHFAFVRDPIERFLSGFVDKIFKAHDKDFEDMRDNLTANYGVDLSDGADMARSCGAFADYICGLSPPEKIDIHFRPQCLNLALDVNFPVDKILKLEDQAACIEFFENYTSGQQAAEYFAMKQNPSNRSKDLRNKLDLGIVRILLQYYAMDYEKFGYDA